MHPRWNHSTRHHHPAVSGTNDASNGPSTAAHANTAQAVGAAQAVATAQSATKAVIEPISAARYRIQLDASVQLKKKLEHAIDLLSHSIPSGDLAIVIERALDVLIERVERERFAQNRSRRSRTAVGGKGEMGEKREKREKSVKSSAFHARRHIPNEVKRQIVARDGLRCTFVGSDGLRCGASRFTQIHHEEPWARGGGDTLDNLRVLCAAHNRLLAERDFGKELVASRIARHAPLTASAQRAR